MPIPETLPTDFIQKFKKIYIQNYGKALNDEEAQLKACFLLSFYLTIIKNGNFETND